MAGQVFRNDASIKRYCRFGCGSGVDTIALKKCNINAIPCDISESALLQLKKYLPDAQTLCFDMTKGLPFETESVDVIISDLSLHYFDIRTTSKICLDLHRVLRLGGVLICRVNSINDYVPDENDIKIDENYYFANGYARRFFRYEDIERFFGKHFRISVMEESITNKYSATKHLIEFLGRKINSDIRKAER